MGQLVSVSKEVDVMENPSVFMMNQKHQYAALISFSIKKFVPLADNSVTMPMKKLSLFSGMVDNNWKKVVRDAVEIMYTAEELAKIKKMKEKSKGRYQHFSRRKTSSQVQIQIGHFFVEASKEESAIPLSTIFGENSLQQA